MYYLPTYIDLHDYLSRIYSKDILMICNCGMMLLSPRVKRKAFLYLTSFVFFYKIGEGMDTACKSVTFAAEIGTWLDSHRLDLY